jgi:ABC-type dipeptide/oligopeptide/nickel transport system permease component
MTLYILRRLLWAVLVVNVVVFITFLVFYKLPNGHPALRFVGRSPTQQSIKRAEQRLHLNEPFYIEYFHFAENFFHWGRVREAWPRLLVWQLCAAIWLVFGVTIGVVSAARRRTAIDRAAMGFVLFGISAPVFWLGLMAAYIFWVKHLWIPGVNHITAGSGYVPLSAGIGPWRLWAAGGQPLGNTRRRDEPRRATCAGEANRHLSSDYP